jgi:hypothetical protein
LKTSERKGAEGHRRPPGIRFDETARACQDELVNDFARTDTHNVSVYFSGRPEWRDIIYRFQRLLIVEKLRNRTLE